jgi:hypothetical protein
MNKIAFETTLKPLEDYLHKSLSAEDMNFYFEHLAWADESKLRKAVGTVIEDWRLPGFPRIADIKMALYDIIDKAPGATAEDLESGAYCSKCKNTGWVLTEYADKQMSAVRCDSCAKGRAMIAAVNAKRNHAAKVRRSERDWTTPRHEEENP